MNDVVLVTPSLIHAPSDDQVENLTPYVRDLRLSVKLKRTVNDKSCALTYWSTA